MCRWQAFIAEYSLVALKLARKRGMNGDIHIAEIPKELLEDTLIDYNCKDKENCSVCSQ